MNELNKPKVWILMDDRDGNTSQCVGLAARLNEDFRIINLSELQGDGLRKFVEQEFIASPKSDRAVLISASSATVTAAQNIKKLAGNRVFNVKLSSLNMLDPPGFDFVARVDNPPLAGLFDRHKDRKIRTIGVPHKITPELLQEGKREWEEQFSHLPEPRIAVMLGGKTSITKDIDPDTAVFMGMRLNAYAQHRHASLIVTNSRRTSDESTKAFMDQITVPCYFHDNHRAHSNPYLGILGVADEFVVTSDSMSMMCEACSTGKPVYYYPVPEVELKMHKVVRRDLEKRGCIRPFGDDREVSWTYPPLDAAGEIADAVLARMNKVYEQAR